MMQAILDLYYIATPDTKQLSNTYLLHIVSCKEAINSIKKPPN